MDLVTVLKRTELCVFSLESCFIPFMLKTICDSTIKNDIPKNSIINQTKKNEQFQFQVQHLNYRIIR